ncbi:hypothetical protein RA8CHR_02162 [Variovorax sp. RA8]|nr:hypothetical protein RA8CHR_02162 [Variovorax sp. RA8]
MFGHFSFTQWFAPIIEPRAKNEMTALSLYADDLAQARVQLKIEREHLFSQLRRCCTRIDGAKVGVAKNSISIPILSMEKSYLYSVQVHTVVIE